MSVLPIGRIASLPLVWRFNVVNEAERLLSFLYGFSMLKISYRRWYWLRAVLASRTHIPWATPKYSNRGFYYGHAQAVEVSVTVCGREDGLDPVRRVKAEAAAASVKVPVAEIDSVEFDGREYIVVLSFDN